MACAPAIEDRAIMAATAAAPGLLPACRGEQIARMTAAALALDPRTTALVLIDLQKGIVARELTPHTAAKVLENAQSLGRRFNEADALVVFVHVTFSADGADRLRQPVDSPMAAPPGGFPPGWADFADELSAVRAGVVITKRQWSAFHGTELDLQLRRRGITTIVLGGIATNFGVESTARDAWQHGYELVVTEDACTSMGSGSHEFSVERILPRLGRVRSTAQVLGALQARRLAAEPFGRGGCRTHYGHTADYGTALTQRSQRARRARRENQANRSRRDH